MQTRMTITNQSHVKASLNEMQTLTNKMTTLQMYKITAQSCWDQKGVDLINFVK